MNFFREGKIIQYQKIKKSKFFSIGLTIILTLIFTGCGVNSIFNKKLDLTPVELTDSSAFFVEYYGLKLTMGSNISAAFNDSNLIVVLENPEFGHLDEAVPATELLEPDQQLSLSIHKKELTWRDRDCVDVTIHNSGTSAINISEAKITNLFSCRLTSDASNKELYECSTTTINGIGIGTKLDDVKVIFSKYENLAPHYTSNYMFASEEYSYLFKFSEEELTSIEIEEYTKSEE